MVILSTGNLVCQGTPRLLVWLCRRFKSHNLITCWQCVYKCVNLPGRDALMQKQQKSIPYQTATYLPICLICLPAALAAASLSACARAFLCLTASGDRLSST